MSDNASTGMADEVATEERWPEMPGGIRRKEHNVGTVNEGLFTSTTDEWPTPQDFFDAIAKEFPFTLDACASSVNAKCALYFTKRDDGLSQPWTGVVWMNPPYGRQIGKWIEKAHTESSRGATVVCLIPARTDTRYWHDYVMRASEVRFIKGRLHFNFDYHEDRKASGESKAHNAPFPSVLVVFRPESEGPPATTAIARDGTALHETRSA